MSLRKLSNSPWSGQIAPPCFHPEHYPPSMIVLEPGTYEHTCPGCGTKTIFVVPRSPSLTAAHL